MKKISLLAAFLLFIAFTSFKYKKNNGTNSNFNRLQTSNFYGQWIQIYPVLDAPQSEGNIVRKFKLKKDFTAIIEFLGSRGNRTVAGSWETNKVRKFGSKDTKVLFQSDIFLKFSIDKTHDYGTLLKAENINGKINLVGEEQKFGKD